MKYQNKIMTTIRYHYGPHRSTAEKLYPSPKVGARPRMPGCIGTGAAEGSYPMLEVRGSGREEQSHIQGAAAVQS